MNNVCSPLQGLDWDEVASLDVSRYLSTLQALDVAVERNISHKTSLAERVAPEGHDVVVEQRPEGI